MSVRSIAGAATAAVCVFTLSAASAAIRVVGFEVAPAVGSWALGISPDGACVGGWNAPPTPDDGGQTRPPDGWRSEAGGESGITAMRFRGDNASVDLGSLGGAWCEATAASSGDHIVGWGFVWQYLGARAFRYSPEEGFVVLETLGGSGGRAAGVNAAGQIVGSSAGADGAVRAFRYTPGWGMEDLGSLAFGSLAWSWASGINASGDVVGWGYAVSGEMHAFRYVNGEGMRDLGDLGGGFSQATAINDQGDVVGWARTAEGGYHAFLSHGDAGMLDLGDLGGGLSQARGVNGDGTVVGWSRTESGEDHAFVWTWADGMIDLDTVAPANDSLRIVDASGINNAGQVSAVVRVLERSILTDQSLAARLDLSAPTHIGDLNGDGAVNSQDLSIVLSRFGTSDRAADINRDGVVDALDLRALLQIWRGG